MEIIDLSALYASENTYICYDPASMQGFVIDPGAPDAIIMKEVRDNGINIKGILLTHGHFDHLLSAEVIKDLAGCSIYAHSDEALVLGNANLNMSAMVLNRQLEIKADVLLSDNDVIECGASMIKVIHTPGHTPGGVCYYLEKENILFSGDTLFKHSIGRSDLPLGDGELLNDAIITRLFTLDDSISVYPGHGGSTTIGDEKKKNPYVRIEGRRIK